MGKWIDDATFSAEILDAVRLAETYHLEAIEGTHHNAQICALDTLETWSRQIRIMTETIAEHGAPVDMPDDYKSLVGGQLIGILVDLIGMLEKLSPEPDQTVDHSVYAFKRYAQAQIDGLIDRKQKRRFETDLAIVLKQADRIIRGSE